jgi:predicted dehydrogenase
MKFALLGVDHDALELIGLLCQAREHELRVVYDVGGHLDAIREFAPRVEIGDAPEALLARQEIDAVIVATSADQAERERQLRILVQGGLRLVVMLPICDSLSAYELEMIRSENKSVMVPYSAGRGHPAIEHLAELIREGDNSPIGVVEQIVFERHMSQRQRATVMPQLCCDGHLMGRLIGDIEGVSATGDRDDPYKSLSVGLNGSSGLTARWSVVPSEADPYGSIALHGERGKVTLEMPANAPWRLVRAQDDRPKPACPDWDVAGAVVKELEGQRAGLGTWFDACRDLEIADHVAASLRRRRTIEIRRDGNPEENAFKGIMSAGGCLILLLCLLVTRGFAVVEGFRMPMLTSAAEALEMRNQEKPRWHILLRLWPVYPLLAFLAMQALLVVAKSGQKDRSKDRER